MFMKMNSAAFGAALMLIAGTVNADAAAVTYSDFTSWSAGRTWLYTLSSRFRSRTTCRISIFRHGLGYLWRRDRFQQRHFWRWLLLQHWARRLSRVQRPHGGFVVAAAELLAYANILITLAAPVKAFALNFDTLTYRTLTCTFTDCPMARR